MRIVTGHLVVQVELKGVTAIGLRALIEYAYTGTIVINDGNLQDVLEAADHLQFVEILTFCSRWTCFTES